MDAQILKEALEEIVRFVGPWARVDNQAGMVKHIAEQAIRLSKKEV